MHKDLVVQNEGDLPMNWWNERQARLQALIDQYMVYITPSALLMGIIFTNFLDAHSNWVPYLFAWITFVMGTGFHPKQFISLYTNWRAMLNIFCAVHVLMPIVAYGAGTLLFGLHAPVVLGFVLFAAIPVGIASLVWVGVSKGNLPFVLSFVILDTLLSPFTIPATLMIFTGDVYPFDSISMMKHLLFMVGLPTLFGMICKLAMPKAILIIRPTMNTTSKFAFLFVLVLNAAAIAPMIGALEQNWLGVVLFSIALVAVGYSFGGFVGKMKFGKSVNDFYVESLLLCGLRNLSLGLVIATQHLPTSAAAPVILSILIQQPAASIVQRFFVRKRQENLLSS